MIATSCTLRGVENIIFELISIYIFRLGIPKRKPHIRAGNQLFLGISDKIRKYRLTPNCLKLYAWIAVRNARENYLLHSTGAENGNTYSCISNSVEWIRAAYTQWRFEQLNTRRNFIREFNVFVDWPRFWFWWGLEMRISNALEFSLHHLKLSMRTQLRWPAACALHQQESNENSQQWNFKVAVIVIKPAMAVLIKWVVIDALPVFGHIVTNIYLYRFNIFQLMLMACLALKRW